jgi:hypothetical protein
MRKYIFSVLFMIPAAIFSQVVGPNEIFTDVNVIGGKVVFLKEIALESNRTDTNYTYLHDWMKTNYGGNPFVSSLDFKKKDYAAHAISRVEMLLSENSRGQRTKMIMKYVVDAFITERVCVLEITNVTFLNDKEKNDNSLPDKLKAEDMITDNALLIRDGNEEIRENTRKSVLFFLNELSLDLEKALAE